MEQKLNFTLQECLSSPPVFIGQHEAQSLVFCIVICTPFVFFPFGHRIVFPFYDLWLLMTSLVSSNFSSRFSTFYINELILSPTVALRQENSFKEQCAQNCLLLIQHARKVIFLNIFPTESRIHVNQ